MCLPVLQKKRKKQEQVFLRPKLRISGILEVDRQRVFRDMFPLKPSRKDRTIGSSTINDAKLRFFIKFKAKNILSNEFRFFPKLK